MVVKQPEDSLFRKSFFPGKGKTIQRCFLLLLFIAFLSGCAKPPVKSRPLPEPMAPAPQAQESPLTIMANGQRVSPLVPTLFLLPEDPIVIHTRKTSPTIIFCQDRPSPEDATPLPALAHHRAWLRDPGISDNPTRQCLKSETWTVALNGQPLSLQGNNRFQGKAPKEPGLYTLEIDCRQSWLKATASRNSRGEGWEEKSRESILVVVLHSFSRLKDGFIDLFPMGTYAPPGEAIMKTLPKTALSSYLPPKGFIKVTPENRELLVSKHYRLQDFQCHLFAPYPHYMALSPSLLLKLELLTLKLQESVHPLARLTILSGFRTPWHNQTVSTAPWSRHLYGDAADVILDVSPHDGVLDDLNQDGRIDREDVLVLAKMVEKIEQETGLAGGLGVYDWDKNGKHGPFLHIDTRGFKTRW